MPKYKTLDQRIKWKGQHIGPDTEVAVSDEEAHIWDALVRQKAAVRLEEPAPKRRPPRLSDLPGSSSGLGSGE